MTDSAEPRPDPSAPTSPPEPPATPGGDRPDLAPEQTEPDDREDDYVPV